MSLAKKFTEEGFRTKRWVSQKGASHGGKKLSPKYVYRILTNPIYCGEITHKGELYPGQHKAVIEKSLWEAVQEKIEQKPTQPNAQSETPYLLKGKFRHHEGYSMSPSTFKKKQKDGSIKKTRYYVSQKAIKQGYASCDLKSINAQQIESLVISVLISILVEQRQDYKSAVKQKTETELTMIYKQLLRGLTISPSRVNIEVSKAELNDIRMQLAKSTSDNRSGDEPTYLPVLVYEPKTSENQDSVIANIEIEIKQLDGRRLILGPNGSDLYRDTNTEPNPQILAAFRDAYSWRAALNKRNHSNAKEMAKALKVNYMMMLRKLPLTTLAPDIQRLVFEGPLPERISLKHLFNASQELSWQSQRLELSLNESKTQSSH